MKDNLITEFRETIEVILTEAKVKSNRHGRHDLLVVWTCSSHLERATAFLIMREVKEDRESLPLLHRLASHEDLLVDALKPNTTYELKVGTLRTTNS